MGVETGPVLTADETNDASPQPRARRSARGLRNLASLQTELIVPYIILTILIAMAGTYVITRLVTSSIRERFDNQIFGASGVAADSVVRQEQKNLAALRLLVFTDGIAQALAQRNATDLQNRLLPLVLNSHIEAVTAVDAGGQELLTLAYDPAIKQYVSSSGTDFSKVELVTTALRGQADAVGDKFAGLLTTAQGSYLFTSAPVRDANEQIVGALLIGTRLSTLVSDLQTQSFAQGIVVLDRQGKLSATTLAEPEAGYAVLELTNGIVPTTTQDLQLYGRSYQIAYTPLIIRQQTIGTLGVVLASNFLVNTEATSRDTFSLIFAVVTVAVVVLGYILSRSIARPILRLRALSQAVAAGDLNQETRLSRSDEIGELAVAFDAMTQHLRERTAEAARHLPIAQEVFHSYVVLEFGK